VEPVNFRIWEAPPAQQKVTLEVRGNTTIDNVLKTIRRIVKRIRDEGVPNIAYEMQPRDAILLARKLKPNYVELANNDDDE
jgi:hypothetical protein